MAFPLPHGPGLDHIEMAQSYREGASGATRQRRWWQLRHRWSALKEGLRAAVPSDAEPRSKDELTAEHYKVEETGAHEGFQMQTFSGPVFARLRHSLGITEEEYRNSLSSEGCYLQFISNSKSKADFFLTHDKRFFLKTQSRREVTFLLSNLQAYALHLEKYPHSLMVRFLGVYRIVIANQLEKYFVVMQSVFYPDERINIRYDIKGCELGRWTNPDTQGEHILKVLKDNNFNGQHIALGQQKAWFVDQVKIDIAFLRGLNVLDYSLLLALQPLHKDELDSKRSLANLVICTTKSLVSAATPTAEDPSTVPLLKEGPDQVVLDTDSGSTGARSAGAVSGAGIALQEVKCPSGETGTDPELQEFHARHRRLLSDCKNPDHVLDGPDRRYFVGLVDVFTVYDWRKRLENLWKRLRYPGQAFSTVSPSAYAHRFCQWVQNHTR